MGYSTWETPAQARDLHASSRFLFTGLELQICTVYSCKFPTLWISSCVRKHSCCVRKYVESLANFQAFPFNSTCHSWTQATHISGDPFWLQGMANHFKQMLIVAIWDDHWVDWRPLAELLKCTLSQRFLWGYALSSHKSFPLTKHLDTPHFTKFSDGLDLGLYCFKGDPPKALQIYSLQKSTGQLILTDVCPQHLRPTEVTVCRHSPHKSSNKGTLFTSKGGELIQWLAKSTVGPMVSNFMKPPKVTLGIFSCPH